MDRALDVEGSVPLVVDLDGTLTLSDTLHEGLAQLLFRAPSFATGSLPRPSRRIATLKRAIADRRPLDVSRLPYRQDLVELINREKLRGRPVHLVTAADQSTADAV